MSSVFNFSLLNTQEKLETVSMHCVFFRRWGEVGRGQTKFIMGKMKMVSEAIKTRCEAREDASFELAKKVNFFRFMFFFLIILNRSSSNLMGSCLKPIRSLRSVTTEPLGN